MESLQLLDTAKSVRPDGIHPAIIKPSVDILAEALVRLFNASLDEGKLSRDCLESVVIPERKGGNKDV